MTFLDNVIKNVEKEAESTATVLAKDWLNNVLGNRAPVVQTAPAPAGTLPEDMLSRVTPSSNLIKYVAIGAFVFLVLTFFFRKKAGK